jgi:hypothetical protein
LLPSFEPCRNSQEFVILMDEPKHSVARQDVSMTEKTFLYFIGWYNYDSRQTNSSCGTMAVVPRARPVHRGG